MKKEKLLGFLLKKIHTEQFAIFEDNFVENIEVNLSSQIQFKLDHINCMIGTFVGFTFEQEKKPFLKIEVSCHFKLEENSLKGLMDEKESKTIIPKEFLAHLAMVTTGTARGVLFAKTEGTFFNTFIIPTINIEEMIEEDGEFPMQ
jgi:hypothetical protein